MGSINGCGPAVSADKTRKQPLSKGGNHWERYICFCFIPFNLQKCLVVQIDRI